MSAVTTQQRPEAATPQWLLPALSFASSMYLYVLVALAMIAAVATFAGGLTPHIISTGSMSPAIKPGDIVLTNDAIDRSQLGQGTVITYEHPEHAGSLVTHRIVGLDDDGTYQTKGDANRVEDSYTVPPDNVVGAGQLVVPLVGLPATWLRHGLWLEFGLFLLASTVAFAGATLKLEDDEDDEPPVPEKARPGADVVPLRQRVGTWAEGQVAAIAALATVVLATGAVALDRRSGVLFTERLLEVVQSGGGTPIGLWRLAAVAVVALSGFAVVKVALGGGRWELAARRYGVPQPVTLRLAWFERNGSIFVGVLAIFVLTGAGTALAQTAAGAFTDSADGGTSTATAATLPAPGSLTAEDGCLLGLLPTEVHLSWNASTGADQYEVYRVEDDSILDVVGTLDPISVAPDLSLTDSGLDTETTYTYAVRAVASSWTSPYSEVTITTPLTCLG